MTEQNTRAKTPLEPERRRYSIRRSIEKLKAEIPLERYAARLTELERQGTNLVGLCPIHTEKTPSFTIYPDERFYCFGCQHHGDLVDLCELAEKHSDVWTAVVSLSLAFGVELPRRPERWHGWQDEKARRRRMIRDTLAASYQRRYFRLYGDHLAYIEDAQERRKEAQQFFEGLWPLAVSCAELRMSR